MTAAARTETSPPELTSTKLVVHDLDGTNAFYCEAYGFIERARVQAEMIGEPIDEVLLGSEGSPGVPLILMQYTKREAPPAGKEVALVIMADDLDALFRRVKDCGGQVLVEPYQSEHAPMRVGFTTDPEGHVIENLERPRESGTE